MSRAATLEKPVVPFNVDGFTGVRDQRSQQFKPGEMLAVYNMMPEARDRPSRLVLRPGYKRWCAAAGGAAAAITGSGSITIMVEGFLGGSYRTCLMNSNGIYLLDHFNFTSTLRLSAAQIVAAGANISSLAQAVFFNGKLIVATASAKPWSWDGTAGGGVTLLANAPTACTSCTVYGGKLFFVTVGGGPIQMQWSEEGDETIGYATAPYSNFWTLAQQGQNNLEALVGTNDGLVYFRLGQGIGIVGGDVDSLFKTTSTKDAISTQIGLATSTAGAKPREGATGCVMFFDDRGRPCLYRPTKGVVQLWKQLPRAFGDVTGLYWDPLPWSFSLTPTELVAPLFGAQNLYYDKMWDCHVYCYQNGLAFLFDAASDRLVSVWVAATDSLQGLYYSNACLTTSGNNFTPAQFRVDGSGNIFWQDVEGRVNVTRTWSEEAAAGVGVPVKGTIIGPPHGNNPTLKYWFDRVDVLVDARAAYTIRLGYVTSARHKGALTPADLVDAEAGNTNVPYQAQHEFGLEGDVLARWLMPQIQLEAVAGQDQQLAIDGYRIEARPDGQALGTL